jgi:hypothetical protein
VLPLVREKDVEGKEMKKTEKISNLLKQERCVHRILSNKGNFQFIVIFVESFAIVAVGL